MSISTTSCGASKQASRDTGELTIAYPRDKTQGEMTLTEEYLDAYMLSGDAGICALWSEVS